MGLINKFLIKKCVLCHKKDGDLILIDDYGIYGCTKSGEYAHKECIKYIICNPEKFSHRKVDKALDLFERLKEMNKRNFSRKIMLQRRCKKIKGKY